MSPKLADTAAAQGDAIDSRYHPSAAVRRQLNKVFPTHWSFLLGEIALYSFIVLLITGVYLTLFFDPSMTEVTYDGVYQPLRGVEMSRAYASALDISFEVRGGLFVRQILLILAMFEGYFGYSLPDDVLSGIGLRAALSSITLGLPVVGTWMHWALFGGDFPGDRLRRRAGYRQLPDRRPGRRTRRTHGSGACLRTQGAHRIRRTPGLGQRVVGAHTAVYPPPDDQRHQHSVERPRREGKGAAVGGEHLETVPLRTENRAPPPLRRAVAAQRPSRELGSNVVGQQSVRSVAGRASERVGGRDVADREHTGVTGDP
jgi:hypothetical protein